MKIDFYHVDAFELSVYQPVWQALRSLGADARLVAPRDEKNRARKGWFDHERFVALCREHNLPFVEEPDEDGAGVTTQNVEVVASYRGPRLRLMYGPVLYPAAWGLSERATAKFDRILAHGPFYRRWFAQWKSSEDVPVVGYPRYDDFFAGGLDVAQIRASRGVASGRPVVLYLPTWSENSSFDRFIESVAALRERHHVIVRPHHCTVRFETTRMERLVALGIDIASDAFGLPGLLAASDIVLADARSCSLLEAMMCGRRPIALAEPEDAEWMETAGLRRLVRSCAFPGDLTSIVARELELPADSAERQAWREDHTVLRDGTAARATAQAILDAVEAASRRPGTNAARTENSALPAHPAARPGAPRVSVVLPTYNHREFLPLAVESLRQQTFKDFELIIVNDGSTDGTQEYLDGLKDPRIHPIHQSNQRLPRALNAGFEKARGELLTWTSADNYCSPIFLEALVGALDAHPDAGMACAAFASIDEGGLITRIHRTPDMRLRNLLRGNPGNAAFLYRRACQDAVGPYAVDLEGAEDWDMWLRIAARFATVGVKEILYYYRRHRGSMTARQQDRIQQSCGTAFQHAMERMGGRFDLELLYPSMATCADHHQAENAALLDLGTLMLRSPITPTEIACNLLARAVERNPGAVAIANLAIGLARLGRWDGARECLQGLPVNSNPRVRAIAEAVRQAMTADRRLQPSDLAPLPVERAGIELFNLEAREQRLFSWTQPMTPSSPTLSKTQPGTEPPPCAPATPALNEINVLSQVEAMAREAVALNPNGVEGLKLLARVCVRRQRWAEGALACARVLERSPADVEMLLGMAQCFFHAGEFPASRAALERTLEVDPDNPAARGLLADCRRAAGLTPEEAVHLEGLLRGGQELMNRGEVPEAIRELEQAADLSPNDADLAACLGNLHALHGNPEAARTFLSRAVLVEPSHAEARAKLLELTLGEDETPASPAPSVREPNLVADPSAVSPDAGSANHRSPPALSGEDPFSHLQLAFDLLTEDRFDEARNAADRYREMIHCDSLPRSDHRVEAAPKVSVVIVAYKIGRGLIDCLDSLADPGAPPHEIIVVDNGGNEGIASELGRRQLLHVRMPMNVILAEGRNVGVHFARAPIAVFIDDDALAARGYLASIMDAFERCDIEALRGRVLPKSEHANNRRGPQYDLGEEPMAAAINAEGNSAFRVETWRRFGGQDPLLFGGEGVDLSYRISRQYGTAATLYWPWTVIHHNYAEADGKVDEKKRRHRRMRAYLQWKHPEIGEYHATYKGQPRSELERISRVGEVRYRAPRSAASPPTPGLEPDPAAALASALERTGWTSKADRYQAQLHRVETIRNVEKPEVSIIVISHELRADGVRVLKALREETGVRIEVIYVINGMGVVPETGIRPWVDTIISLRENTGAYFARNVGAAFAAGPILLFLDDDAIPAPGCVAAHVQEFRRFDVIAVRGAVLPKTANPLNQLAKHYHLGERRFPIYADIEGNTSYLARTFFKAGGWDDEIIFGTGGVDLAFRLLAVESDRRRQIYSPAPVVFHDFAASEEHLARKRQRQAESRARLRCKHPDYDELLASWRSFAGREDLLIPGPEAAGGALPAQPSAQAAATDAEPLITIAIPTFNRAAFLPEALRSALAQTYPRFEVVVVDDGSTDGTAAMMEQHRDPRIRYILKEHSGGPQTRNRCIAEARGEFIVWLDSDDSIFPNTLALYAAALGRQPEVDVLYGNILAADEHLAVRERWMYTDYDGWKENLVADTLVENRIPNVCTLVRKACYDRIGGYNPEFPRAHDYEFWTRLVPVATVKSVNTDVGIYRRHEDSLSRVSKPADMSYDVTAVRAMLERHDLRTLFSYCYRTGAPLHSSDSRAWLIAGMILAKYGDLAAALQLVNRSVEAADLAVNARIRSILQSALGRPAASTGGSGRGPDEWLKLIETARRRFAAGEAQPCAAACARLTEVRPDAPETLLLVALSLRRWGNPNDAKTAFRCLLQRLTEQSYLETVTVAAAAPSASAAAPAGAEEDLTPLVASAVSGIFESEPIPVASIRDTLAFIAEAAAFADPARHLAARRVSRTPLFEAIIGIDPDELRRIGGDNLERQVARIRSALPRGRTGTVERPPGYSFCIITGGGRRAKLERQIASIQALGLPRFEILVGGNVTDAPNGVRKFDLADLARSGRLGRMRNHLARHARYDHVVVSDDDLVFGPGFAGGLGRFGEDYEAMGVRIVNPDGSRFWDWATTGGPKGSVLLDYWETDPKVYLTGGFCVLKTHVLDHVSWDEARGFYEQEDVDFSARLKAAGVEIRFNPFCMVIHDDDRYTRVGRRIFRFDHLLAAIDIACRGGEKAEVARLLEVAHRLAAPDPERRSALAGLAGRHGLALPKPGSATSPSQVGQPERRPVSPPAMSSPEALGRNRAICVAWQGSFLDHGSLSHVNRALTAALEQRSEIRLSRMGETTGLGGEASRGELAETARRLRSTLPSETQVTIRHAWPPDWSRPTQGSLIVIQPWEYGVLPQQWVDDARNVDEFWVPSEFVRKCYVDSGVRAERVHVVPNGVDTARFHPGAPPLKLSTNRRFKFLFVGGTIHRKGPDVLLRAYLEAFTAQDDVCLVIKDFGGDSVYSGQTFEARIKAAQALPNAPEILYLNEEWPPEKLPGLYTACDALVHPYRGEGFGLPVLEAMACGLPVVVTEGGPTDEFVPRDLACRVKASRRRIGREISGMKLAGEGWLLEPDVPSLVEHMRALEADPGAARIRGRALAAHAREHASWDRMAEIAVRRILEVRSRSVPSAGRPTPASPAPLSIPQCARLGHLGQARECLGKRRYREAWSATVAALMERPFHPEAWLLLAEIAAAAGDLQVARQWAQHARKRVPDWKPVRKFLKKIPQHGRKSADSAWLAGPPGVLESTTAAPGQAPAGPKPRLSVYLIVRNEEAFLSRCLASVKPIADQIVVLDTGSTDRTVQIAREFGAEVHDFEWCDDFSAARNAAMEHVRGDWVLALDADEELPLEEHARLEADLGQGRLLGLRLPLVNVGVEEEGLSYVPRLFRNAPGLFYVSRVHEQVFSSVLVRAEEWGLDTALGTARLRHHGYTKAVVADRRKTERNLRLLEQAVDEIPHDANLLMNLGLELVRSGRSSEGLARYEEAFQALSADPDQQKVPELRETLLTQLTAQLLKAGRFDQVVRVLESPVGRISELSASLCFTLGMARFRGGDFQQAIEAFERCLARRNVPGLCPIHPEILKAAPRHCLALCLVELNRLDDALEALRKALGDEPGSRPVRRDLARLHSRQGRLVEALTLLHQLITEAPGDEESWRLGSEIALGNAELLEFALDWTGEAVKHRPTDAVLASRRAEALLLAGDTTGALPFWRQGATQAGVRSRAALALCELLSDQSPGSPGADETAVSREFLLWYQRLVESRAHPILLQVNDRLPQLARVLPTAARGLEAAIADANFSAAHGN